MSKDLIERARNAHTSLGHSLHFGLCSELADRIEQLEQQLVAANALLARATGMPYATEGARAVTLEKKLATVTNKLAAKDKQIVMLRVALSEIAWSNDSKWQSDRATQALDATADLSGYILCDAKPVAWQDCSGEPHRLHNDAMCSEEATPEPLYKAKEQK